MSAPLPRIPIAELRTRWEREGPHGPWRELLRAGYAEGEPYFEFGVMPETKHACAWRIVLDHEVPVWLCATGQPFEGEHVVRPDDRRAGQTDVSRADGRGGVVFTTHYVTVAEFQRLERDAADIHREYADPVSVSFWSIPDRWFSDRPLVQLLSGRIVNTEAYRARPRGRSDWYRP
jgi:hypothetical protein